MEPLAGCSIQGRASSIVLLANYHPKAQGLQTDIQNLIAKLEWGSETLFQVLRAVPNLADVRMMARVLESVGAKVAWVSGELGALTVDASSLTSCSPDPVPASLLRASFFAIGR